MKIKIGEDIEHGNQKFIIVDIKHHVTMDESVLVVMAYDPNMADKEQQKSIKVEQIGVQVMDFVKKLTEGGGFSQGG